MNTKHNDDMFMQDLIAQKDQTIADRTDKTEIKTKVLETKAAV
jgi:hypothetical protein